MSEVHEGNAVLFHEPLKGKLYDAPTSEAERCPFLGELHKHTFEGVS